MSNQEINALKIDIRVLEGMLSAHEDQIARIEQDIAEKKTKIESSRLEHQARMMAASNCSTGDCG